MLSRAYAALTQAEWPRVAALRSFLPTALQQPHTEPPPSRIASQMMTAKGAKNFTRNLRRCEPEELSELIYQGAGTESMYNAAAAWQNLAHELFTFADTTLKKMVSGLIAEPWTGSAAQLLITAHILYVDWVQRTAAEAEIISGKIRQALGAYETARATIMPPKIIRETYQLLLTLRSSNTFRLDLSRTLLEESYENMCAHNVEVMITYWELIRHYLSDIQFPAPPRMTANNALSLLKASNNSLIDESVFGTKAHRNLRDLQDERFARENPPDTSERNPDVMPATFQAYNRGFVPTMKEGDDITHIELPLP